MTQFLDWFSVMRPCKEVNQPGNGVACLFPSDP